MRQTERGPPRRRVTAILPACCSIAILRASWLGWVKSGEQQHGHDKARCVNGTSDLIQVVRLQTFEEAVIHFEAISIKLAGHFNPFENGHGSRAGDQTRV